MTAKEQLIYDLGVQSNNHLLQWVKASRVLFEMADVDEGIADRAIFMSLIMAARHIAQGPNHVDVDEVFDIVREQYASH